MFGQIDKDIIKELQGDIPICSRPYEVIAEKLGISEKEFIDRTQNLIERGIIRRFGAILNHRKAGFTANAMVVWVAANERVQEVGSIMASFKEVTHCYQRPSLPDWPYNMFTMIHGSTREQCEEIVQKISEKTQIDKYEILYSITELKKTSMRYFEEENPEETNA